MRLPLLCIAIASLSLPPPAGAMSHKPEITVRFHTETNRNDSAAFAVPVSLIYQHRQVFISNISDLSEKQIDRILPFPAKDGSWGCVFKLNSQGRIRLETLSGEIRGSALVLFVSTKAGRHHVADWIIDRPVADGIITVPRGLSTIEILLLKKQFKILGAPAKQPQREKSADRTDDLPGDRFDHPMDPTAPSSRRHENPDPGLPRLPD
jgi:hypothetical protein